MTWIDHFWSTRLDVFDHILRTSQLDPQQAGCLTSLSFSQGVCLHLRVLILKLFTGFNLWRPWSGSGCSSLPFHCRNWRSWPWRRSSTRRTSPGLTTGKKGWSFHQDYGLAETLLLCSIRRNWFLSLKMLSVEYMPLKASILILWITNEICFLCWQQMSETSTFFRMFSTSKMTGKLSFNEKLHKYLQSLASKPGQGLPIKALPTH